MGKVRGYLEACHYLFELENWKAAGKILSIRLNTPTGDEFHNQLNTWVYYREQLDLFTQLLGKLNTRWEMVLLNGLVVGWALPTLTLHTDQMDSCAHRKEGRSLFGVA